MEPNKLSIDELANGMADAIFYLGGGNEYLGAFGRLCFCSGCQIKEKPINKKVHSSACEDLWKAWATYEHAKRHGTIARPAEAALAARLAALEQQHAADELALRMAREALTKYADRDHWLGSVDENGRQEAYEWMGAGESFGPDYDDPTLIARAALAALPEPTDAK